MSHKAKLAAKIEAAKKLQADLLANGIISVLNEKTGEIDINMADNRHLGTSDIEGDVIR